MGASEDGRAWVLWAGTCDLMGDLDLRIEAAARGPYSWVSLSGLDLAAQAEKGRSAEEVGQIVRAAGLRLIFDPVIGWHSVTRTPVNRFTAVTLEDSMRGAADLLPDLVSVVPTAHTALDAVGMVTAFREVCDRVAEWGAEVQLEFMPFSSVPDLRTAWELVEQVGRADVGIVIDSWHFFRSDPDFDLLASIDGRRVFSVQLSDDNLSAVPGTREQTLNRLLPGTGEFDLDRFLQVLDSIGALRRVGAEVIMPAHESLAPSEAAAKSHDSVLRAFVSARLSP